MSNVFEPTYYATKNGEFYKNLPFAVTNIADAAEKLERLSREFQTSEIQIFERFRVIGSSGNVETVNRNVTQQCLDVLWNYYAASQV